MWERLVDGLNMMNNPLFACSVEYTNLFDQTNARSFLADLIKLFV